MNNYLYKFIKEGRKGNNKGFDYTIDELNKHIKIWNSRYYLIFAFSGVGKSKFVYHQHIFNVIDQQINNNIVDNLCIDLYSLEIGAVTIKGVMLIFYLHKYHNIITDLNQLFSYENKLPEKVMNIIESKETLNYMNKFDKYLNIYTRLTFPTLINNTNNQLKDLGEIKVENKVIKSFKPNSKKYLYQIIIDHISLTSLLPNKNRYETIGIISKYLFAIRDITGVTPVVIQQVKHDKTKKPEDLVSPDHEHLRDSPETFNDCDIGVAIGSPFKHKIKNFKGYKIYPAMSAAQGLQDRFRFVEIKKSRYSGGANYAIPTFFIGETSEYLNIPKPLDLTEKKYIQINNLKKTYD